MTAVATAEMTSDAARNLTDRIKVAVEGTWHLITEAYTSRAWSALGYSSWDDYCTREFGTSRLRLPREERSEVVASLRESGLSIRAIASATGTGTKQVQEALRNEVWSKNTPQSADEFDGSDWHEPEDDDEVAEAEIVEETVTGLDGKTYPKQAPKPASPPRYGPRRRHCQVIESITVSLSGLATAAEEITELDQSVTPEEAARLSGELSKSLAVLRRLNSLLTKETSK